MKKLMSIALLSGIVLLTGCNKGGAAKADLSTDDQKVFYTIGFSMAERMKNLNLNDKELAALTAGLHDAAKGDAAKLKLEEYRPKVRALFEGRMKAVAQNEKKSGMDFLAKFAKTAGVQKTKSGLAYQITKEGTGAFPKPTDVVEVHYHGTLTNGEVFDSSKNRGKTVTFPLNQVIKGWTEGMQKVKEGGSVKLVIPSELAYGDNGAPPKIPGGATLVFDVELVKIVKDADKKMKKPAAKKKDNHKH
jgi:FKBP-type peptidyl-prolyl cis-trans isomerase FkpA